MFVIQPLRCASGILACNFKRALRAIRPARRSRAILLLSFNILNLIAATAGLIYQWADVSTFFLGVVIANFMVYLLYYFIMKVFIVREHLNATPFVSFILSFLFWIPALYFFTRGLTSWVDTPAVSREGNQPCTLLDFFDSHDVWHMLSSGGLFFGSVALLTLDDDLVDVERYKIPVF